MSRCVAAALENRICETSRRRVCWEVGRGGFFEIVGFEFLEVVTLRSWELAC